MHSSVPFFGHNVCPLIFPETFRCNKSRKTPSSSRVMFFAPHLPHVLISSMIYISSPLLISLVMKTLVKSRSTWAVLCPGKGAWVYRGGPWQLISTFSWALSAVQKPLQIPDSLIKFLNFQDEQLIFLSRRNMVFVTLSAAFCCWVEGTWGVHHPYSTLPGGTAPELLCLCEIPCSHLGELSLEYDPCLWSIYGYRHTFMKSLLFPSWLCHPIHVPACHNFSHVKTYPSGSFQISSSKQPIYLFIYWLLQVLQQKFQMLSVSFLLSVSHGVLYSISKIRFLP